MMQNRDTVINELNSYLKGEEMAIESYDRLIQEVGDVRVRQELSQIQSDHRRHADQVSQHIRQLGGIPSKSTGFAGFMAGAKSAVEKLGKRDDLEIVREAYDGEDKGIAMADEIVKGDLDDKSREMIQQILSVDHDHLKRMANLIGEMENLSR